MEGFESIHRLWRTQNIHCAIPGIQLERGHKCRKCRARRPVLLQQPRHQSIPRSFRFDEDILCFVFLSKLNPFNFAFFFPVLLCTVKLGQLVFLSPPAVRAQHGKLSWQTSCALHRNFERALRTTHAAHVSVGGCNFPKDCHGGLLS